VIPCSDYQKSWYTKHLQQHTRDEGEETSRESVYSTGSNRDQSVMLETQNQAWSREHSILGQKVLRGIQKGQLSRTQTESYGEILEGVFLALEGELDSLDAKIRSRNREIRRNAPFLTSLTLIFSRVSGRELSHGKRD